MKMYIKLHDEYIYQYNRYMYIYIDREREYYIHGTIYI